LRLDFTGLSPEADLDVDVLLKVEDGRWERRQLTGGSSMTYCLSNPGEAVEELYLILSNHNRDLFSVVEGEFTAQVLGKPCAA
jgi:hypothetical protein